MRLPKLKVDKTNQGSRTLIGIRSARLVILPCHFKLMANLHRNLTIPQPLGGCEAITSFFKKYLEDISPFCGATDTPVLHFW